MRRATSEVEAYESDHDDLNKILSASDKAFEQIQTTVKGLNAAKSYYSKDDAEALSDFIHHAHQTEKRLLKNDKEIVHEVQEKKLCKKFLEKMNTNLDLATKFLKDTVPKLPNQEYKEDITAEQAYLLQFIQERVNLYSGDSCKAAATYY
ncbi:hypothetical protein XA68_11112 [Ophiocordyceps unilateralis]|uniref:Uncharacterized protein n=1 Tax=Ophiocordyceps unilateralis TaxID=268505 RepID=A0A2A9PFR3_OPHUN|nr:hypothetical protein XA68_11112 [Ophiocordyceps unilateralis]